MAFDKVAKTIVNVARKQFLPAGATLVLKDELGATITTMTTDFAVEGVEANILNEAFTRVTICENTTVTAEVIPTVYSVIYEGDTYKVAKPEAPRDNTKKWVLRTHKEQA